MVILVEERSRVTAKGQTTVPKSVRQALGIGMGDEIAFLVSENGVALQRVDESASDPAMDSFLRFLAEDVARNPGSVAPLPKSLMERIAELTAGMDVDPDAPIDGDVEI